MDFSTAETLKNGGIGAVIAFILVFVPVIGFLAPLFGGGVSGYLQGRGISGGAAVGLVMAVLSGVPAFLLGVMGLLFGSIPLISGTIFGSIIGFVGAAGGLLIIVLWFFWTIYALMLGLIGGAVGGAVAS